MTVEFWVMRVLLHPGPIRRKVTADNVPDSERAAVLAAVDRGALTVLPDGCIAEPLLCFSVADDAHNRAAEETAKHPEEDFRVILNADVTL